MEHRYTEIEGMKVAATDGEIGKIVDLYFDDERWGVRYLVVNTGGWLSGRNVLISPRSLQGRGWAEDAVRVALTREQVENSPPIETARPVSRHYEVAHAMYYGYPYYWTGPYLWGLGAYPMVEGARNPPPVGPAEREMAAAAEAEKRAAEDSHLRSCVEVVGYRIEAQDGSIGHLQDFLVDDETWGIPYLVVDRRAWLPGGLVVVPPDSVDQIDWGTSTIHLTLTREAVKQSPEYP